MGRRWVESYFGGLRLDFAGTGKRAVNLAHDRSLFGR